MTKQKLASLIAQMEGKKTEVSIGNIREVLRCIEIIAAEEAFAVNERYAPKSPALIALFSGTQSKLDRLWKKADKAAGKVV